MEAKETGEEGAEENAESASEEKKKASAPLPASVERALAQARAAVKADRERKGGRWLAVVPAVIAAILLALMMPRATRADAIPLPRANRRVTEAIAASENALAAEAEATRLSGEVLAVGTGVRELNAAEAADDKTALALARQRLDGAMNDAMRVPDDLLKLRAVQTRLFLAALESWERGAENADFAATGAALFVQRAELVGWARDRRILLDETQRRVAFKTVWNAITHLDQRPGFALVLDEERALYAFYLQHPRPPETARELLATRLREAKTPEACDLARTEKRRQEEMWRAEKIKRLGAIDAAYPTDYALGVAYARGGRADLAIESYGNFLAAHPDGPYAILARNHLKAALADEL